MKNLNFSKALIVLIAAILLLPFAFSCKDSSAEDGSSITAEDLEGVWLKVWDGETFDYDGESSGSVADAMILEIEADIYKFIFYYETRQVGGNSGTFTITDSELIYTPSESWSSNEYDWVEDTVSIPGMPVALDSSSLDLTLGETVIGLVKTVFGTPEEIPGRWEYDTGEEVYNLELYTELYYDYSKTDGGDTTYESESGIWSASGTDSGYIRVLVSDFYNGESTYNDCSVEGLFNYSLVPEELTVFYYDGTIVYVPWEQPIPQ